MKITEKIENYLNEANIKSVDDFDDDKAYIKYVLTLSDNQIKVAMKDSNILYPSGWPENEMGPYPAKLARVLIKTEDRESLTDFCNIYYTFSDKKKLSPEAIKVFQNDVIDDMKTTLEYFDFGLPNGFVEMAKANPDFTKKMFLKMHEEELQRVLDNAKENDTDEVLKQILAKLKIELPNDKEGYQKGDSLTFMKQGKKETGIVQGPKKQGSYMVKVGNNIIPVKEKDIV